ncbi:patatin-like phospholipase family protein [uncultured Lamprocystis sp.]|jgi:NTE family protein|uniref:patatin-like phospholipase family protein n=1 Tax=uncultured Lamprocystis sp. TaxID=543132 RepID=UPI0025CE7C97|nr:patatin-like phospholipase family protein [uncultured Lamprocystis sp.]
MKRLLLPWSLLLLCCIAWPGFAADAPHPRIGLVLSGGGARGAAHVGVLKVLEELRIPISAIAGTSMGALVGGVYAGGMSAAEMERRLTTADWDNLLLDDPPRQTWPIRRKQLDLQPSVDLTVGLDKGRIKLPGGALAGQKVENFFSALIAGTEAVPTFDDLPIPFRAVATDLEDGGMKVFDAGPLPEVMRASMSVPGVFAPVEIGERIYVDGGLVRNLPVDVARRMGVDLVIAVNLGSGLLPRDRLQSVVGVMAQMLAILTQKNVQDSLAQLRPDQDILISPDLGSITSSDFNRAAEAIRRGETAARAAASALHHLSLSPAAYAAWRTARARPTTDEAPIAAVEIAGLTRVNPALFAPLAANQQGQPLDRARLESDIQTLYGLGDFKNINYDLNPLSDPSASGDRNRLLIRAHEKPWGPGYLSFGLGVSTDFEGDDRFGLRATYRRPWVNPLGGEWLTTAQAGNLMGLRTEFYQPLTIDRRVFVAPSLSIGMAPLSVFKLGTRIARYELVRDAIGLDLGSTLPGGNAELRIGAFLGTATPKRDTGVPEIPEQSTNESGLRVAFRYDTLDSATLPRRGNRVVLDLRAPEPVMGADLDFQRVSGHWTAAYSIGAHTLVSRAEFGAGFGDPLPYYDQFALGGFQRLSGYAIDELRGERMAFGALTYYYRLTHLKLPLTRGVYVGGSLEVGTLEDTEPALTEPGTRFGSSLFLGVDTLIGPAYLGLGISGDGEGTGYISIGWP